MIEAGGKQALAARWVTGFGTTLACELRRFVRHRLAVVSALVLPIAMAILMTSALGGDPEVETRFAVADLDGGPAAGAFLDDALRHPEIADMVTVDMVDSPEAVRHALDQEKADAGIVLPEGLTAALADPTASSDDPGADQPVVHRSEENLIAGDLAALLVDQFTIQAHATMVAGQAAPDEQAAWPLQVDVTAPDGNVLDGATAVGPPVALFFVLATLGFAAQSLVADRERASSSASLQRPRLGLLSSRAGPRPEGSSAVVGNISRAPRSVGQRHAPWERTGNRGSSSHEWGDHDAGGQSDGRGKQTGSTTRQRRDRYARARRSRRWRDQDRFPRRTLGRRGPHPGLSSSGARHAATARRLEAVRTSLQ